MALYGQSYTILRNCTFRNHAGQGKEISQNFPNFEKAGNGGAAAVVSASALFIDSYFVNMTGQESGGVISALGKKIFKENSRKILENQENSGNYFKYFLKFLRIFFRFSS